MVNDHIIWQATPGGKMTKAYLDAFRAAKLAGGWTYPALVKHIPGAKESSLANDVAYGDVRPVSRLHAQYIAAALNLMRQPPWPEAPPPVAKAPPPAPTTDMQAALELGLELLGRLVTEVTGIRQDVKEFVKAP
jgi:hypothetical protein